MIVQLVLLLVGLLLVAGTFVYVTAEFSLVTVDRATVAQQAAAGDRRAQSLLAGLRSLSTQLSGAQIGITVTTLALGFVMEPSLASLIADLLHLFGVPERVGESIGVPLALVIATVLSMVFGELVAKSVAIADPMAAAKSVVGAMRASTTVFRPLIWALNGTANGVLKVFGIEPQEELRSARAPDELQSLVRRSAAQGTLATPTAGLLDRSISFSGKSADDVLTPRTRVRFVRATDSADTVITAAVETGHSRFPVIGEDSDDVVGLVHLKRAVAVPPDERARVPVSALTRDVPVVPGTMPLDDLLDLLRERGFQLAVVADEYGGTAGILTLEDVVEELVGEIRDEHDPRAPRPYRRPGGSWVLPGTLRPDQIREVTGVELPESGAYETVAGLVVERLGRLAEVGDSVVVGGAVAGRVSLGTIGDHPGDRAVPASTEDDLPRAAVLRLTVVRRARRRIESVVLSAVEATGEDAGEAADRGTTDRVSADRRPRGGPETAR
ncbi:hemolysin family protein [Nakamurella endophytica]|uniref:Membrane protein n=1 Tax=Nakamurella endophytica TaxID=1748367 RepID=A0A917SNW9_9ACTN|nr:CNNM domain-containing protein [Nakamurella endophytica]GGL91279.1 membrane protein [Nakamurella endophytica]